MKKISIFACIICILVLASCNFINKPQMEVYYDDFYSESPIATEPSTMKSFKDVKINKDSGITWGNNFQWGYFNATLLKY